MDMLKNFLTDISLSAGYGNYLKFQNQLKGVSEVDQNWKGEKPRGDSKGMDLL
jgi:hypothetical protein